MSSSKAVKLRIKAAKNISQITKAMEMVSAAKMRRSQEKALNTRPYAQKLLSVLSQMSGQIDAKFHRFLRHHEDASGTVALILISTDRGLCGALNSNLFRGTEDFKLKLSGQYPQKQLSFEYITLGRKGREHVLKTGQTLHAEFTNFPEYPTFADALPIAKLVMDGFETGRFWEVHLVYMDFVSTLKQVVRVDQLLPLVKSDLTSTPKEKSSPEAKLPAAFKPQYLFEPDEENVLNWLLPYFVENQIYQKILESRASEHSSRMVTMRGAHDNATEVVNELTLIYNRERQQSITNEIADIVTSILAIN